MSGARAATPEKTAAISARLASSATRCKSQVCSACRLSTDDEAATADGDFHPTRSLTRLPNDPTRSTDFADGRVRRVRPGAHARRAERCVRGAARGARRVRLPERARALTVPGFKSPGSIRDAKIFSPQLHAKRVAPRHVAAFDARVRRE